MTHNTQQITDTIDRIIGMNYSIAQNNADTDRYSDARVVSYVVRGI